MREFVALLKRPIDAAVRPVVRVLRLKLGLSPDQLTWASFVVSAAGAVPIVRHHVIAGLVIVFVGQLLDGLDGRMAREFGLASTRGQRLDDVLDRSAEGILFAAFAAGGYASWSAVGLAFAAVLLVTSIGHRSGIDPGVKRFALYFGPWLGFPVVFAAVFWIHLAAYVVGLLVLDCRFQLRMDALGGDLDTVASRAAAEEVAERRAG
ncbi:MAG TPA: CDP-alcohol phosphatidyltransferase family protein [Gemmatimonadales bacterium]|nr:CDP-alcohol phosphatidyltransferase family protein [Gemmatimonadales bacterium]